jgi:hypothetical protein
MLPTGQLPPEGQLRKVRGCAGVAVALGEREEVGVGELLRLAVEVLLRDAVAVMEPVPVPLPVVEAVPVRLGVELWDTVLLRDCRGIMDLLGELVREREAVTLGLREGVARAEGDLVPVPLGVVVRELLGLPE